MGNQPHRERSFNSNNTNTKSDVLENISTSETFHVDQEDIWPPRGNFLTTVESKGLSSFANPDSKTTFTTVCQDYINKETNSSAISSVYKDEKLKFLSYSPDGQWAQVEKLVIGSRGGEIGWVPVTVISDLFEESHDSDFYLQQFDWYHGEIPRSFAEYLLNSGITGSFLVRESESNRMLRSISLRYEGKIWHFRISKDGANKYYVTDNQRFDSIPKLIEYHSKYNDGLPCQLLYAASRRAHATVFGVDDNSDCWEIDRTEIMMKHQLGGGQYGIVYEGFWTRHKCKVAVKTVKSDITMADDFLEEARLMKSLQHPNLVRLLGVCTREPPNYIITEFMENGNLLDYLRKQPKEDLSPPVLLYMAIQIAGAMAYLEKQNFIHRDLAARNCLVGVDNIVKVADFGLARCMERDDTYTAHAGAKFPIKWTAPEGLAYNLFSTKSDVWAFGVLLWELATYGMTPYPGIELQDVYVYLQKGNLMCQPSGCPENIYELMKQCWQWQPDDRPSFEELHNKLEIMLSDINEQVDLEIARQCKPINKPNNHHHHNNNSNIPVLSTSQNNHHHNNHNNKSIITPPSPNLNVHPHPKQSAKLPQHSPSLIPTQQSNINQNSNNRISMQNKRKSGPPAPPVRTTTLKDMSNMSMTSSFSMTSNNHCSLMEHSFSDDLLDLPPPENDNLPLPPPEDFLLSQNLTDPIPDASVATNNSSLDTTKTPTHTHFLPRLPKPKPKKSDKVSNQQTKNSIETIPASNISLNPSYLSLPKTSQKPTSSTNTDDSCIKRTKSDRSESNTAPQKDFHTELRSRLKIQSKTEDIDKKISENKQQNQQHNNDSSKPIINNLWSTRKSMGHIIKPSDSSMTTQPGTTQKLTIATPPNTSQVNTSVPVQQPMNQSILTPVSKRLSWTGPMSSMATMNSSKKSINPPNNLPTLASSNNLSINEEPCTPTPDTIDEFLTKETLMDELNSIYRELTNIKLKQPQTTMNNNYDSNTISVIIEKLETIHLGSTRYGNSDVITSAKIKFRFIERCTSLSKEIENLRKYVKPPFKRDDLIEICDSIKTTLADLKLLIDN